MRGTLPLKIGRAMANLTRYPQYIPRCLAHNVLGEKTPLDLELPWFAYAAIDFLERFVRPEMEVCEYGSGGSTVFFARRAKSVFSIEDDTGWYERVRRRIRDLQLQNVTLKLCPFDFKSAAGFESSEYLHAMPDQRFDIIVIDGSEEWIHVRPICFTKAEARVKPGGVVVVDDSWRYPQLREQNHAARWRTFKSVGPGRPGVTTTDVFFY